MPCRPFRVFHEDKTNKTYLISVSRPIYHLFFLKSHGSVGMKLCTFDALLVLGVRRRVYPMQKYQFS